MKNTNTTSASFDMLSEGVRVNGTYTAAKNVKIAGTIDGDVHIEGTLVIDKEGVINGNIFADEIYVSGKVTGILRSPGKITLRETAVIVGDLYTPSLAIEEHAIMEGLIHTTNNGLDELPEIEKNEESKTEKEKADVAY